ncbi:MAG: Unknown protein [uncultured Sulfurovum sp.]|uniref:Uncharacterized protein n=1 Tax=uncultured Sulfurovum sp. TaxID=269237 RepID=A0A6S6UBQ7_9BACT|nr:MAG: Unknown protein [uncultured Sulfurovum sp.]
MQEYRSLALIVLAIFVVTLLGAYFSPTFEVQKGYLELFILFGAILFIVSTLAIFATLGFSSFALYMAVFLAAVIALFGILGAVIVTLLTYISWGSIFAMEVLLYDAGALSAKEWFTNRYTFKDFKAEYYAFYPLLGCIYLLLEIIPNFFKRESVIDFSPSRVLKEMEEILD